MSRSASRSEIAMYGGRSYDLKIIGIFYLQMYEIINIAGPLELQCSGDRLSSFIFTTAADYLLFSPANYKNMQ